MSQQARQFNFGSQHVAQEANKPKQTATKTAPTASNSSKKGQPFKSQKVNNPKAAASSSEAKPLFFSQKGAALKEQEVTLKSQKEIAPLYRYCCVLDFEAVFADDAKTNRNYDMEIIEFPSVLLEFSSEKTLRVVDQIQNYVKTRRIPKLNSVCIDVTGITQETIDTKGISFEQALVAHNDWLTNHLGEAPTKENVLMITCGDWDLKTMIPHQVYHEPNTKKLVGSHFTQWCNLKDLYGDFFNKQQVNGMVTMLNGLKLELQGKHHSGIDDCKNIARVACELVSKGCSLVPTARLTCEVGSSSRTSKSQFEYVPFNSKQPANNFQIISE